MDMREAFETWASDHFDELVRDGESYETVGQHYAWLAWQAASELTNHSES